MTKCTAKNVTKSIQFSSLNHKKVEASFSGGAIGTDGGLLLLREVDKKLKLTKRIRSAFIDKRHPSYIDHTIEGMLKQRIYALAAGYEDVNDHDYLRKDRCFQTAVGREVDLASGSTLSRFENAADRRTLVAMSHELVELFISRHKILPKKLTLDFDPTDHQIYGHQEERHYHGYYQEYCYLPLHVFCGEHLLVSLLRPSNRDGSRYAGSILRLLVKRFQEVWPSVKILFRGDCAFARKSILHWCERNKVDYVVGISGNARLQRLANSLVESAKKQYEETGNPQRLFDELSYGAESWSRERRIIIKAEHHSQGTNLRFLVTNRTETPQMIYDQRYCPRGNMENGIKQLKLDLYSDRNSCHAFLANQFRVLLSSLAYILLTELRLGNLQKTSLAKAYCQSIRLKLFKIGVMILKNTRRIQFLFESAPLSR